MAQSRFSRRSGDDDFDKKENIAEEKKKGGFGAFAAKAKEKLGSAAGNIKGVFSKDGEGKKSRTADADTAFVPPSEPAPQRTTPPASTFSPDLFDDFTEEPAPPKAKAEPSLPSRWDARQKDSDLYFSSRMSDKGFRAKEPVEFEEKKRPAYQGKVTGLSRNANEDDDGEHYYVPNIEVGDEERRLRYKKRNRRPLKLWQKGVITGVCITAAFIGLIMLTVNLMLVGKMNQIDVKGSKDMNDLYFYEPTMVTSILDDSVSISEDDRSRLSKLNDAFEVSDLSVKSGKNVQNYLLIALDEQKEADGIVIVSVDQKTKKIRLVNILSDLYVPLADQIDGVNYGSSLRRIYNYGGASLLRSTVQDTFKVKIDYYFVLNFTAFETIVNHLGGADITITDEAVSRWMATNEYDPQTRFGGTGRFTLNGEEALIYSRMSQLDGPFARSQRQQEVASKLCARLSDYDTLELVSVLYNALSYVTTDCGAGKLLSLCGRLDNYSDYEIKGVTVPISGTYTEGYVGGEYLLAANLTVNANDVQLFLYSNDMTYADGGTEVNVMLPQLTEVLDVPEEPVSGTDISPTDTSDTNA